MRKLVFAVTLLSLAVSPALAAKPVTLVRAPANLADLAAKHARGEDVRAPLRATLTSMLPGWYFTAREGNGKPVTVQKESDGARWLHVHLADPSTFKAHLFGGGHYNRDAKFNLLTDHAGSRISRLSFDGRRLRVRLDRTKEGRGYDHGTRFQDLELEFDDAGRAQTLILGNSNGGLRPFGRSRLEARLPQGTFRTQDSVSLPGSDDPDDGSTSYSN